MTPQETRELEAFLGQLVQAGGLAKDPQAEQMINRAVVQQPDSAYLLVLRAMLLDQALKQAQAQIEQLQAQVQGASSGGAFLNPAAWGNSARTAAAPPANTPSQAQFQAARQPEPLQPYGAPMAAQQQPGLFGGGMGGMGGILGSMAATAAGVAGGAFLYQGINSMLHSGDHAKSASQGLAQDAGKPDAAPAHTDQSAAFGDLVPDEKSLGALPLVADAGAGHDGGGDFDGGDFGGDSGGDFGGDSGSDA